MLSIAKNQFGDAPLQGRASTQIFVCKCTTKMQGASPLCYHWVSTLTVFNRYDIQQLVCTRFYACIWCSPANSSRGITTLRNIVSEDNTMYRVAYLAIVWLLAGRESISGISVIHTKYKYLSKYQSVGVSILRTGPDRRTGSFCLAIKVFIGLFYGPDRKTCTCFRLCGSTSRSTCIQLPCLRALLSGSAGINGRCGYSSVFCSQQERWFDHKWSRRMVKVCCWLVQETLIL